jgi:hypothetical protein
MTTTIPSPLSTPSTLSPKALTSVRAQLGVSYDELYRIVRDQFFLATEHGGCQMIWLTPCGRFRFLYHRGTPHKKSEHCWMCKEAKEDMELKLKPFIRPRKYKKDFEFNKYFGVAPAAETSTFTYCLVNEMDDAIHLLDTTYL